MRGNAGEVSRATQHVRATCDTKGSLYCAERESSGTCAGAGADGWAEAWLVSSLYPHSCMVTVTVSSFVCMNTRQGTHRV